MNDREPFDGPDSHLREHMERAVRDLPRAPDDVVPRAMARGRRQRSHRRLGYAAGGIAAATALVLTVPTFATDWPGQGQDPDGPPVAADAAATTSPSASPTAPGADDDGASATGRCDPETGWWSKSSEQIQAELAALLPEGTRIGETSDGSIGTWDGTLVTGDDSDFVSFELSRPEAVKAAEAGLDGGRRPPACGAEPVRSDKPCDEITSDVEERVVACEEIRSEDGTLIGMVTDEIEMKIVNGQARPTDRTHVSASVVGPGGGFVGVVVYDSAQADTPDTVLDPADVPALTMDQAHEIVTDAFWTS